MKLIPIDVPANWQRLGLHPICECVPKADLDTQCDVQTSIAKYGFDPRHPVVLYDGKILDGRTRWVACRVINKPPMFCEFEGDMDAAAGFVIRENLNRRHISKMVMAMAVESLNGFVRANVGRPRKQSATNEPIVTKGPPPRRTVQNVAEMVSVSPGTVKRARSIMDTIGPDRVQQIIRQELKIPEAIKQARAVAPPAPPTAPVGDRDELGRAMHPNAVAALTQGRAACRALYLKAQALKRELAALLASPWGDRMAETQIIMDFGNAFRPVHLSAPYTSCPMAATCDAACGLCRGSQWITKSQWDNMPPEYRRIG